VDLERSELTSSQEFSAPKFLTLISNNVILLLHPVEKGEGEDKIVRWLACCVSSRDELVMADRFWQDLAARGDREGSSFDL